MKYVILLWLTFASLIASAQITEKIYNTWVVSKVTYQDGSPLPDDNLLKYVYLKYSFSYPNKANLTNYYKDKGVERYFEIKNGYMTISTEEGGVMNVLKVILIKDTLMLTQQGKEGFSDPTSITYHFVPEINYQNAIPIQSKDIQLVIAGDTTYNESPKIYASYKGLNFLNYMYAGIAEDTNMHGRSAHFVAMYTVFKSGIADSLKIVQGIDNEFDKRFVKVFNKARKEWQSAAYNHKKVNVRMRIDLRYMTSEATIPAYFAGSKGNNAYNSKEYEIALYYFDEALKSDPSDKEMLYRRGMCKELLGNKTGACEDWNHAKILGSTTAIDAVLEKYCK